MCMRKLGSLLSEVSGVDKAYEEILSDPVVVGIFNEYETQLDMSQLPNFMGVLDEFLRNHNKCSGCNNVVSCRHPIKGHYPTLEPSFGRLKLTYAPCNLFKSQSYLQNIQSFHMPVSMGKMNFENMYMDEAREQVFILARDFITGYLGGVLGKGLFLHGSHGTGKTYVACAIANELAKSGIECALVYFPELISKIKSGFGNSGDSSSEQIIGKLQNIPVLMLDDIGSESVTSWMRDEILGRILNHRMMQELPTFFTSNFDYKELQVHYQQTQKGEYEPIKAARVLERIKALSIPVRMVGSNYRNAE